ncbi:ABC transporter substrate-binding protein [Paenibacillus durus]|uniref:ABC transporter substrate-binding protein n=1 Tax=Paenibacillus durus TaxID=44251 RepID=UPI0005A738C7|nr:ABC transporter substrate-binding protein [Paenibacillus durus]
MLRLTQEVLKKLAIAGVTGGLVLTAACASETTNPSGASSSQAVNSAQPAGVSSATRVIKDATGRTVTIPKEINRIAAAGALAQMVCMLGGFDKIVATSESVQTGMFAKLFPGIKNLPLAFTGTGPSSRVNMEAILEAEPQVVFSAFNEEDAATMQAANSVMLGTLLNTPDDIMNTLRMVGEVIGPDAEKKASDFAAYYKGNIQKASDLTRSESKVRVFLAGGDGSKGAINTTVGNDINTSYVEAAGGINIAAAQFPKAPGNGAAAVDFEYLIAEQPDVIIASSRAVYDYIVDADNGSKWQSLTAVKNKKVYLNPKGVYLWSVRSAEGALQPLWLAKILHPEQTSGLDLDKFVKDFYKTYYFHDLSDKELQEIYFPSK